MSESWIEKIEHALASGTGQDVDGVEILRGQHPPLLDAHGTKAVLAPFLAALVWGAAVFRETMSEHSLDLVALGLRILALGLTIRAALLLGVLFKRLALWWRSGDYALALCDEGLLYRTPRMDVVLAVQDVVGIKEQGDWDDRPAGRRHSEVFVITRPQTGKTHLALPPVFAQTPGILAERLMRWCTPTKAPADPQYGEPHNLASKVFDDAAQGRPPEGATVIRHGNGWLRRGPYLTVLAGIAALDGMLRLPTGSIAQIGVLWPALLIVVVISVPGVWLLITRREIAPRKGIALLFTKAEILMRTRAGILRTRYQNIVRLSVESKRTWSLLEGYHLAQVLVIERRDQPPIRYEEAFLGVPAEIACGIAQAYRRGALP